MPDFKMKMTTDLRNLIELILKIPGAKILTLATGDQEPFVIDVSEDGVFGYDKGHKLLFKVKLASAIENGGGLIIRQFLTIKVERKMPNGKKLWIPRKNIYGISLGSGSWRPLSTSEVKLAHCIDHKTGKPIPPEPDVSFCDLSDII